MTTPNTQPGVETMPSSMDHPTLVQLIKLLPSFELPSHVAVRFQPGGWSIHLVRGEADSALVAGRSKQLRLFKRLDTVVSYLQDLGVEEFTVNGRGYDPSAVSTYQRPDAQARLSQALASKAAPAAAKSQARPKRG